MSTTPTRTFSRVGRVDGDLDVRVDIQDGVVVDAWAQAGVFGGRESGLRGKDPRAALAEISGANGAAGVSHRTCAVWALDTAWGTHVPRNAILARNLAQIVEMLRSIPGHHYGRFMVDYTNRNYVGSPFYDGAVQRWAPLTGTRYELGLAAGARLLELLTLLNDGRGPYGSAMVPGGVTCALTPLTLRRAWGILERFRRDWLESVWLGGTMERYERVATHAQLLAWLDEAPAHASSDLGMFYRMSLDIGVDRYGRGRSMYVSWGNLPHEDRYQEPTIEGRDDALVMKSGVYDGGLDVFDRIDPFATSENASRYDAPLHPGDGRLETGPLARQLVAASDHGAPWQHRDTLVRDMYRRLGGASVMLRHFARMHECVQLYREAERILRAIRPDEPWFVEPTPCDGRGWGATEAVRGALCHWIEVEGGAIRRHRIVAPTTWNVGARARSGPRGTIEESLIGIPIANPSDPVEVGHVCRSYDSSLVCTVHAYDGRSGKELGRFRAS